MKSIKIALILLVFVFFLVSVSSCGFLYGQYEGRKALREIEKIEKSNKRKIEEFEKNTKREIEEFEKSNKDERIEKLRLMHDREIIQEQENQK